MEISIKSSTFKEQENVIYSIDFEESFWDWEVAWELESPWVSELEPAQALLMKGLYRCILNIRTNGTNSANSINNIKNKLEVIKIIVRIIMVGIIIGMKRRRKNRNIFLLKIHHNPKSARVVIASPTMYINANKVIKITTLIKSSGK